MRNDAPIACDLGAISDADRPRYFALRAEVLAMAERVTEMADGFAVELRAGRGELAALAEWIGFERLCCPFLSFRLTIEGDKPVRLELGGAEGVKEFLQAEIAGTGGAKLVPAPSLVRGR